MTGVMPQLQERVQDQSTVANFLRDPKKALLVGAATLAAFVGSFGIPDRSEAQSMAANTPVALADTAYTSTSFTPNRVNYTAQAAATLTHVKEKSDAIAWWECSTLGGWKCDDAYSPAADCAPNLANQTWTCGGGFEQWKGNLAQKIGTIIGIPISALNIKHRTCGYTIIWRNYPLNEEAPPTIHCSGSYIK